jgi:hypothetical protein
VDLAEEVTALLKRSGAPAHGFPYRTGDAAEHEHWAFFKRVLALVRRFCRCTPKDVHMSTILVAILYLRRARSITAIDACPVSMADLADMVLLGVLTLAYMVRKFVCSA